MKIENIHSIRAYQAVKFETKLDTFFCVDPTPVRPQGCEIEVLEGVGVSLRSEKDHVIIPFPNISGIYLDTEAKKEKREAHIADISKPAKAQQAKKVKRDPVLKKA